MYIAFGVFDWHSPRCLPAEFPSAVCSLDRTSARKGEGAVGLKSAQHPVLQPCIILLYTDTKQRRENKELPKAMELTNAFRVLRTMLLMATLVPAAWSRGF